MSSEPLCCFVFGSLVDERRQRSNEGQQLCSGHKENNTHARKKVSGPQKSHHFWFMSPYRPYRTYDCVFPPILASFPRTYWQEHGNANAYFFLSFFFGRSYHSNESSDLFPVANRIPWVHRVRSRLQVEYLFFFSILHSPFHSP